MDTGRYEPIGHGLSAGQRELVVSGKGGIGNRPAIGVTAHLPAQTRRGHQQLRRIGQSGMVLVSNRI